MGSILKNKSRWKSREKSLYTRLVGNTFLLYIIQIFTIQAPPPFPLSPSGSFALENHTPVQWKDGVGPPVVPGGPGHRHQKVAEEIAKKGLRVARVENYNKMIANRIESE